MSRRVMKIVRNILIAACFLSGFYGAVAITAAVYRIGDFQDEDSSYFDMEQIGSGELQCGTLNFQTEVSKNEGEIIIRSLKNQDTGLGVFINIFLLNFILQLNDLDKGRFWAFFQAGMGRVSDHLKIIRTLHQKDGKRKSLSFFE